MASLSASRFVTPQSYWWWQASSTEEDGARL